MPRQTGGISFTPQWNFLGTGDTTTVQIYNSLNSTYSLILTLPEGDARYAPISGGGYVTSVSGTTNRITSTGGTTPILDISATFEALLAKLSGGNTFTGTQNIWDGSTYGLTLGYAGTYGSIHAKDIVSKTANNAALKVYGDGSTILQAGSGAVLNLDINGTTAIGIDATTGVQVASKLNLYSVAAGSLGNSFVTLDGAEVKKVNLFGTGNYWTSTQQFAAGITLGASGGGGFGNYINFYGSSTGYTEVKSSNASGTNYAQTLQPANGVIALLSDIPGGGSYINNGTSVQSSSNYNIDGLATITKAGIGVSVTDALLLTQPDAASLGATKISPSLHFNGNAWNTTGSASESSDFYNYLVPVQGTTPTASLLWRYARAGGSLTTAMTLTSAGNLTLPGNLSATGTLAITGVANLASNVAIGSSAGSGINLVVNKTITGATTSRGVSVLSVIQSDVTAGARIFESNVGTQAASFTLPVINHFFANPTTFGAGSTVTEQNGFNVANNLTSATSNYGFRGQIPSGSNRWNIYMDGSALNYINGNLQLGNTSATAGAEKLQVTGAASISSTLLMGGTVNLKNYTVATLPAGTKGDIAYVTDALTPAYLTTIVGGGAVVTPVFYDGTNWVAH